MVKTTVYLEESEADVLRRLAKKTGKSQSDLIREGISTLTRHSPTIRRLGFIGTGKGSGEAVGRNADEIVRREWAQKLR